MKSLFFTLFFFCLSLSVLSQQFGFTYQAVALDESKAEGFGRDSKGQVLINQDLAVRFSIHENTAAGTVQYQEMHETTTDIFGIFRLIIGAGEKLIGTSLETLQWSNQAYFMQVEIDLGNGFINMGTELIVVPPFGLANTLQLLNLSGTQLEISEGNSVDLSGLLDATRLNEQQVDAFVSNNGYLLSEVDGSVTNELQILSSNGTAGHLAITQGNELNINVNDADADPTNEIQVLSKSGNDVTLSNGGGTISIADNDNDSQNEIQDLQITGSQLTITNNPTPTIINLSPYLGNNLTEQDVDNMVANNGYLTTEVDGSVTNEIQDLSIANDVLSITNNPAPTAIDLTPYRNVFEITNNVTSNQNGNYATDDFVFGSPSLDHPVSNAHRSRMFFDKSKGALRSGLTNDDSWDDTNRGFYSTAFGFNNRALGTSSFSVGEGNSSSGYVSVSFGAGSTASGSFSLSGGVSNAASGYSSMAYGVANNAAGYNTIALGENASALGDYSKVFALNSTAFSYGETVLGTHATEYIPVGDLHPNDRLFTIGNGAYDYSSTPPYTFTRSDALVMRKNGNTRLHGRLTIDADNVNGVGEDYTFPGQRGSNGQVMITNESGILSWSTLPLPTITTTANVSSNANGNYATDDFVFGSPTTTDDGDANHASRFFFDKSSSAFRAGYSSFFAWDESLFPWGEYSLGIGYEPIATGFASVALGYSAVASGNYSYSVGNQSVAGANGAVSIGTLNTVSGQESMILGNNNTIGATNSFAIGNSNQIPNTAQSAFVFGSNSTASGSYALALGRSAIASGEESTALGLQANASGLRSMALGYYANANSAEAIAIGSQASATGYRSTSIGFGNVSSGQDSRAFGTGVGSISYGETALGLWNTPYTTSQSGFLFNSTDRLLSIGNGQDANNRSDALIVLKNGDTSLNGRLTIDADNVTGAGEQYTFPGQDGAANQIMITDGNGNVSWQNAAESILYRTDNIISNENGNYTTDSFVIGSPQLDDDGDATHDTRMFFEKSTGAFRVGTVEDFEWNAAERGVNSVAIGNGNIARGDYSVAFGLDNLAHSASSVAIGTNILAEGYNSIALGRNVSTTGLHSMALSFYSAARSFGETTMGMFATDYTPNATQTFDASDRLFTIGNGTGNMARSNALIVYKNGDATLLGTLTDASDLRLKRNIKPLQNSLLSLNNLQGVHYQWNGRKPQDTLALQTGLIAQEVEKIFPELVKTDDEGFKSVNYIGLVPHLIEAIKELKKENEQLKLENVKTKLAVEQRMAALEEKLIQFEALFTKSK